MAEDMTFDEAAEFLSKASQNAGTLLILEMLRDALEEIRGLSERIRVLETKPAQYVPPPVYGSGTSTPYYDPYKVRYDGGCTTVNLDAANSHVQADWNTGEWGTARWENLLNNVLEQPVHPS